MNEPTDPALMTAEQLLRLYARRSLSPVEALKAVMERVARYNPWVNAFAAMNPRRCRPPGRARGAGRQVARRGRSTASPPR
jgi:aspartyl-tRNA(Asn)/glutamyl-tRNA(Gln) amidotransferase subunit A